MFAEMDRIAREEFKRDSPFWAYYLAVGLEQVKQGLSLEWGLRCVARLLPASGCPSLKQLEVDVDNLASWLHAEPTDAVYHAELAREIWYRPGLALDLAPQRAISQLYAGYALYRKQSRSHPHAVCASITNFLRGDSAWKEKRGELFDLTVEIYQQLVSEHVNPSHG